jgi:hypothetical protein
VSQVITQKLAAIDVASVYTRYYVIHHKMNTQLECAVEAAVFGMPQEMKALFSASTETPAAAPPERRA